MSTTAANHRLSWGPHRGELASVLALSSEGRGHLRWVVNHHDAPPEDRAAARHALQITRPSPPAMAPSPRRALVRRHWH
jgi:hypothetical protein